MSGIGALVRPFEPRPMSAAAAGRARLLHRRRAALPLPEPAGWRLAIVPPPPPPRDALALTLRVGPARARLAVPAPLAAALLAGLAPALPGDAGLAALALELALEPAVAQLERLLGEPVRLDAQEHDAASPDLGPDGGGDEATEVIGLALQGPDGAGQVLLHLPGPLADRLAAALARLAVPDGDPPWLQLPVCLRLAATSLTLAELRSLAPGDALLPGHGRPGQGQAVAVLAERWAWPTQLSASRLAIAGPRRVARETTMEPFTMPELPRPELPRPEPAPDASLDELPIRLVFEVARLDLTLAEIRALAPGQVLDLGREPDRMLSILANGRRIGEAELVRVGDTLAARITALSGQ